MKNTTSNNNIDISKDYEGYCMFNYAYGEDNLIKPIEIRRIEYIKLDTNKKCIYLWKNKTKEKFLDVFQFQNGNFISLIHKEMKKNKPERPNYYLILEALLPEYEM